jgi:hypothetical protein
VPFVSLWFKMVSPADSQYIFNNTFRMRFSSSTLDVECSMLNSFSLRPFQQGDAELTDEAQDVELVFLGAAGKTDVGYISRKLVE